MILQVTPRTLDAGDALRSNLLQRVAYTLDNHVDSGGGTPRD